MGVPVKADAGIVAETVSGAVNAVATETHAFPSQYWMTLALEKAEFLMVTKTNTSEPKAPLLEKTETSK